MKIGLAGVQGAGKTEFANDLKKALEETGKYKSIKIIDDYVKEIEEETYLSLDFCATYLGNAYVALGRYARERSASKDNDVVITCGTVFETATYAAQQMESEFNSILDEAEKLEHVRRVEAFMKFVSCLYIDTVEYDHIFHLPRIFKNEEEDLRIEKLNKNLLFAFETFTLFPTVRVESEGENLEEVSANRVKKVMEIINANNVKEQDVQPEESN